MASCWKHTRGAWYLEIPMPVGPSRKIYLGKIPAAAAASVRSKVCQLEQLARVGEPPTAAVAAWLACCDQSFVDSLAAAGLLRGWNRPGSLGFLDWWDSYVQSRADFSHRTKLGWATARLHASQRWPVATLAEITALDAKTFSRDLGLAVSQSHAAKIVGRCSQVFAAAIDAKLVTENPFAEIKMGRKIDETRKWYVPEQTALAVLKGFAGLEGRAVFALARWCGLRIPHESLALTWSNVDFALNRLSIPNGTKTGPRVVPLFPNARRELAALFDAAAPGSTHVFTRSRASAGTQYRLWLQTACRTAAVAPWPKLWMNLRASCRTDLEEKFPAHVCDVWLGHSSRVAKDHYLRVTPDHWATACGSEPPVDTESPRARVQ